MSQFARDHEADMLNPDYADAFKREIAWMLTLLDGSEAAALLVATGLTREEIDDLGGVK